MKAVFVLFDSLNRHMLHCYGGSRIPTPNFDRLATRTVCFDRHYVGSMPCMPVRRDMLTGRLNFLHQSWGPLEPFDDSFPELLYRKAGVYSHLVTDHYHYFEDGGSSYHTRYDSYEFIRGQENDAWKAMVQPHWADLAPTFLDLFGVAREPEMQGMSLLDATRSGSNRREAALFGYFGGAVNVTDGRFTYHRYPNDIRTQEIFQYTLMPTHINMMFTPEELASAVMTGPLPFTKGARIMKVPVVERSPMYNRYGPGCLIEADTRLYDLERDPQQENPIRDTMEENRLAALMALLMSANNAPPEAFSRLNQRPE